MTRTEVKAYFENGKLHVEPQNNQGAFELGRFMPENKKTVSVEISADDDDDDLHLVVLTGDSTDDSNISSPPEKFSEKWNLYDRLKDATPGKGGRGKLMKILKAMGVPYDNYRYMGKIEMIENIVKAFPSMEIENKQLVRKTIK